MNAHQHRKLSRATIRFSRTTIGGNVVRMKDGKNWGTVVAIVGSFVRVKRNTKRGEVVTMRGHEVSGYQS